MAIQRVFALCCLALFLLAGCSTPLPKTTETVSWTVTNNYPRTVMLEFYSQNRNAAWPGGGEAYVLRPGEEFTYNLSCRTTEQICYGAWVETNPDIYWGTGMDDEDGCDNCCMLCFTDNRQGVRLID